MSQALHTQWLELEDEAINVDDVADILGGICEDPWVVAAAADKFVDNVVVQRALLNLGLERSRLAMERSMKAMLAVAGFVDEKGEKVPTESDAELQHKSLVSHFSTHPTDELICRLRAVLLTRLDKLETYDEIFQQWAKEAKVPPADLEYGWNDLDPWDEEPKDRTQNKVKRYPSSPPSLPFFLRSPLLRTAISLASNGQFAALEILLERHPGVLSPHRLHILQSIPEHSHPSEFRSILPIIDSFTDVTTNFLGKPWRRSMDWTEQEEVRTAFRSPVSVVDAPQPFTAPSVSEVSQWYQARIHQVENAGLVDIALAWVQHGVSQGVPDLDELGEVLNLLSRLVYDAPRPTNETVDDDWSLARWNSLKPMEVVCAYVAYSTPVSIANDIRLLVMPYLYVLESREERAGHVDSNLVNQFLHEYLLQAPLELVAAIFDASKPTLASSDRFIKSDEDMARLALACLYGSDSLSAWPVMSRIFECLPEWNGTDKGERDEADVTLHSLADFVTPSTAGNQCTPRDLLIFFNPLPASSLSHLLDVLDMHLESGEILAKWGVPAPMRWFLQSANDEEQQRAWAIRISRRAGNGGEMRESEDDWLELLEDMLKLIGGGEGGFRGALGLLSREEVTRTFFGGLLSSGNFAAAKNLLRKSHIRHFLDCKVVEAQVLNSSREFYDNSSSGNLHQGDMKLAYDCLTVAAPTLTIQREREFIEATSRIYSFNVVSRPGIPISPIEIRLVKDRLSLVARVLSSTEDAYKHSEVILDLVDKLGYRGDTIAEIKVLAMLADAALQSEDFISATETIERMIQSVRKLPMHDSTSASDAAGKEEAVEVCWHSCFQLGRQGEFHDVDKKLRLLGQALELCPPDHMLDVLNVWGKVEGEDARIRREKLITLREHSASLRKQTAPSSPTASLRVRFQDFQLSSPSLSGPDTVAAATLATRTLKSVAATFPFSVRGRQSGESRRSMDEQSSMEESPGQDVSAHAKQALARGIGWLIGADDQ